MKKKFLTLFLALCLGCSLLPSPAFAAGDLPSGSEAYKDLVQLLNQILYWNAYSNYYDSQQPLAVKQQIAFGYSRPGDNVLEGTILNPFSVIFLYDGSAGYVNLPKDPLGKWLQCGRVNAQDVDWILKNIFNCSEANVSELKAATLSNAGDNPYQKDGYYYYKEEDIGDGPQEVFIKNIRKFNDKYYVVYDVGYEWHGTSEIYASYYAILDRKNIDGKYYWSLYYLTTLKDGQDPLENGGFIDVLSDAYYCQPVLWAVDEGITSGTGWATFSPNATCTRAQILTFLWRANGQPRVETSNPFRDVSESDYFYWAALWAEQKGLVSGSSFQGSTPCTRSMTVTYLWKLAGSPDAGGAGFTDVPTTVDYAPAVAWAVKEGITTGTSKDKFSPNNTCTRGQIVTFLYRAPKALSDTLSSQSSGNSSGSRYQYVIDDCSWTEAFAKAKAAGGYLVRIDDKQEYTDILAEINAKGMTGVEFRIGARRDSDKKDYYWVDANNKTFGEKINADNYWASSEWAAGEPSFRWDVNSEEFVLICFSKDENRWTWNDVADKVYTPGQGKYGYIVEFD